MKAWTPLFFALVLVLGMILGFNLRDTLRSKRDIATVLDRNDRLEQVIDLVNEKYVDSVNSDILYKDAVSGILKSLDPHTVYIPAEETQSATEDLEGGFSGIGVEFSIVRDTIGVTAVVEKGPAQKAGLELGDQLIKVGDSVVAGVNITAKRITQLLRGKQKSHVAVTLRRSATNNLTTLSITRDMIAVHSVDASIMLDKSTGYIKLNKFSASTHKEFMDACKSLQAAGATQFIIDLRGNPGGYLGEATAVADELISDNNLLVYTKGVHAPRTDYTAEKTGLFEHGRLAILVDERSASASEILAGAVQDWDRGVIVGRRSFGKGLVQEPYDMTDGSEIRLTVARYYTPSGRCIQRSFNNGKEAYMAAFEKRLSVADTEDELLNVDTTRFFTANKRVVYGGGGIQPDVYVPYDSVKLSHNLVNSLYGTELNDAIWDYFLGKKRSLKFGSIQDFDRNFVGEYEILANYFESLPAGSRRVMTRELTNRDARAYFTRHIKAQLARFLFRDNGYYSIVLQDDKVVNKAIEVLHSDYYSRIIRGK